MSEILSIQIKPVSLNHHSYSCGLGKYDFFFLPSFGPRTEESMIYITTKWIIKSPAKEKRDLPTKV